MPPFARRERFFKPSIAALLALMLLAQICVQRGLVADAPNFLIGILQQPENFAFWDPRRIFAHILTQFPVVAALKLGIRDIHALAFIYSSWLLILPVLFWSMALWFIRRELLFWPFLALFAFTYFNSSFFAICEFNACFGIAACSLALLLRTAAQTRRHLTILMICAVLLCFSYASTLYFGAGLLALAFVKMRREKKKKRKIYWVALVGLYVISVGSGLWEIIDPRDPSNFAQARDTQTLFSDIQFWISLFVLAATLAATFVTNQRWKKMLGLLAAAAALSLLNDHWQAMPAMEYNVRAFVSIGMFIACAVMAASSFKKKPRIQLRLWFTQKNKHISAPAFALFAILAMADIRTSLRFHDFLNSYNVTLATHTGFVHYEDTVALFDYANQFGSVWTNPLLSLVLRDNAHEAIVLNPVWFNGYQPFDIKTNAPDLSVYYVSGF